MAFISFDFYLFLAVVAAVYFLLPLRFRWCALLCASLAFYWYISEKSWKCLLLLVFAAFFSWICGILSKKRNRTGRLFFVLAVLASALPLLMLKEASFMAALAHRALPSWWIAPVGFSFYSLQLIAYSVDVRKGRIEPEKNFLRFLLFTGFFPQIIQGPIPRYGQLADQLAEGHRFDECAFVRGFMLILWGFFLKLCIADKAGIIVDQIFDNYTQYRGAYVLVGGILYSFQLYADFMSCTCLAQGISGLFGIRLADNFNHPYFSASVKEFWRRWHMSLSFWLRDYIYIPLGGNRKGRFRKYLNLLVTFAVSGIWHGGGWKFLFWGLLHGFYQIAGELLTGFKNGIDRLFRLNAHPAFRHFCKSLITFFLVMFAWIIFRADSLRAGLSMIHSLFAVRNPWILTNNALLGLGLEWKEWVVLLFCLMLLLAVSFCQEKGIGIRDRILRCNVVLRWTVCIAAILFVMVFGTYGYGFDSQAFIYGGF